MPPNTNTPADSRDETPAQPPGEAYRVGGALGRPVPKGGISDEDREKLELASRTSKSVGQKLALLSTGTPRLLEAADEHGHKYPILVWSADAIRPGNDLVLAPDDQGVAHLYYHERQKDPQAPG